MGTRQRRLAIAVVAVMALATMVVAVVGSVAVDALVKRRAADVVRRLEAQLGRKVTIGHIEAALTGVRAEHVTIGGDPRSLSPDDRQPLVTVERIDLRLLPWRTLRVIHPSLNVVRFADGSLNLERAAARLQGRVRRMRHARIDHLRVSGGRMRFVDLTQPGRREAELSGLDFTIDNIDLSHFDRAARGLFPSEWYPRRLKKALGHRASPSTRSAGS